MRWLKGFLRGLGDPSRLWPGYELSYRRIEETEVYWLEPDSSAVILKPGSFDDPQLMQALEVLNSLIPLEHKPTPSRFNLEQMELLEEILNSEPKIVELAERMIRRPTPALKRALARELSLNGFHPGLAEYLYATYKKNPPRALATPSEGFWRALEGLKGLQERIRPIQEDRLDLAVVPALVFDEEGWEGSEYWFILLEEHVNGYYEVAEQVCAGGWEAQNATEARWLGQALALAWELVREILQLWGAPHVEHNRRLLHTRDRAQVPPSSLPISQKRLPQARQAARCWPRSPLKSKPQPLSLFFD